MYSGHRLIFEKGSKKHRCPQCTKKRFVRYIDKETGDYLPPFYGKCDREINCSYHLNPYKDGFIKDLLKNDVSNIFSPSFNNYSKPQKQFKPVFFPVEVFKETLKGYEKNTFIQNLINSVRYPFDNQDIEKVISLYNLGTIQRGYRTGAITFPFIDKDQNIRAVQVKQFDKNNHTTGTDFLHSIIQKHHTRNNKSLPEWLEAYNKNETKVSCLFGEHLLSKYPYNPVALVEAPKTAIYGTLYFGFPEAPKNLIWLAVYNLSSLNLDKCQSLQGRNVYLFPDLSKDGKAFESWSKKANKIQASLKGASFIVSDLLEQFATEKDKEQGKDLADFLIQQNWKDYR